MIERYFPGEKVALPDGQTGEVIDLDAEKWEVHIAIDGQKGINKVYTINALGDLMEERRPMMDSGHDMEIPREQAA